jgi:hypothetical protein
MTTRVHTYTSHTHTSHTHVVEINGVDYAVEFEPYCADDVLHERVGDKVVIAYLSHDLDPMNPMEFDGQGDIYTRGRNGIITDNDRAVESALGLTQYGEPDIDRPFGPDNLTLRELAENDEGLCPAEDYEIEERALDLYKTHWQDIAGPFVIPISYHAERGGCNIYTADWDGDYTSGLPDGVWVANKCAEENIRAAHSSSLKSLREVATEYAESVVREYASWCEGDVYGVCVEVFDVAEFVKVSDEAVWGHVTHDWATREMKIDFDFEVRGQREAMPTV